MNDFEGLLPSDYGFKPSNKSEPISGSRSARPASNSFSAAAGDADSIFAGRSNDFAEARHGAKSPAFDFDSVFDKRSNSEPVYDKPVYDDDGGAGAGDIFDGVPGIRSSSSSKVKYDDVFSSSSSSPPRGGGGGGVGGGNVSAFDDLLGGFGKAEPPRWKSAGGAKRPEKSEKSVAADFDDLFQGFGASSPPTERSAQDSNASKTTSKVMEDPFVSTGQFSDPLEEITKFSNSRSMKSDSVGTGRSFDDVDPFDGLINTTSSFTSERENRGKETSGTKTFAARETREKPSVRSPETQTERKAPIENDWDSRQTFFDMPTSSTDTYKSFEQTMTPPAYASASFKDSNTQVDRSPGSEENMESADDIWLSVSEVPLYTPPTSAPPPSRPPPPRPVAKAGISKTSSANARRKNNEFSSFPNPSQSFQVPNSSTAAGRSSVVSPIDELEDFVSGRRQDNVDEHVNGLSGEDMEMNSVAAAMKEAMDRAQAKFWQAKEVRERENTKASRSKEGQSERDEKLMLHERAREKQERLERQRLQKEREEEEMEQQRLEREREKASEIEREREEREREQRRLEKEKERAREIEKEREKARQAVERATREARERAALDARQRAERAKAERAAVDKATAEARERAERAAVQRAQAEARERAAADAKERAEKAAAEARERANAEAKEREARERAATFRAEAEARVRAAERAAVGRAAAEARERAAAEARERAAAAARANQQKNENDIESFFNSRASSAPRPRTNSSDPFFDTQSQNKSEAPRAPSGNSSHIKKASSATNIVDDLSSIFNAAPTSGDFQDVEGETEERRRARLERHQRTQERAAKALAEKNQRDLQNQREQAERHRFAETLDVEIKRWAAGKEGNLRALLSTLQYVLWQECGWQPVSLTDMITAASVKKVYRKSTLCIHPDKVQQKGANLQQKYVAEKVFDLLKEAWNKFNSEELF